jgi:hypothetical protein
MYTVIASPDPINIGDFTDVLSSYGYTLMSHEPVDYYTAPETELWIIRSKEFTEEFAYYEAYEVDGPHRHLPKIVFHDTPLSVSLKMRARILPHYLKGLFQT